MTARGPTRGFWTAYLAGFTALTCAYAGIFATGGAPAALAARGALAAMLPNALFGTVAIRLAGRCDSASRGQPARLAAQALLLAGLVLASTAAWLGLVALDARLQGRAFELRGGWLTLLWQGLVNALVQLALAAVGHAAHAAERAAHEAARAARAEALRAEAQLSLLRSQLNPHFVLNTLHALLGLVRRDPATAAAALERLGDLLRFGLHVHQRRLDQVAFREEWAFVSSYLALEQLRLGDRLRLSGPSRGSALKLGIVALLAVASPLAVPADDQAPEAHARTTVRLQLADGRSAGDFNLTVVASPADGLAGGDARVEVRGTGQADAALSLEPGAWDIRVEGQGYWARPLRVEVPAAAGDPAEVVVWRTGSLAISATAADRGEAPQALTAVFEGAPEAPGPRVPHGSAQCRIEVREGWSCEVPAALLDVRIGERGFAPRYFWSVRAAASAKTALGHVVFERGASVTGFVQDVDGRPVADSQVTVRTFDGQPILLDRSGRRQPTTTTNARGFFQVVGVPPGEHQLQVVHPRRGRAYAAVDVRASLETRLPEFLVLSPPVSVELTATPALDPDGRPWTMRWINLSVVPVEGALQRPLPPSGRLTFETGAGRFLLVLARGDGTRWAERAVEVVGPVERVDVDLAPVKVSGRLRVGPRPVAGKLAFGGEKGVVSVTLHAGEDGRYAGLLPQREYWRIEVSSPAPAVKRTFPRIEPAVDPATGEWSLDLDLPETSLKGRVVDEAGLPLPNAIVTAQSVGAGALEPRVQVFTAAPGGTFELAGLPEAEAILSAESGDLIAEPLRVVVHAGDSTERDLVARRGVRFRGRVLAESGEPLVGAFVKGVAVGAFPFAQGASIDRSDATGRFSLPLPRGTRECFVTVGGPGHALRLARFIVTAAETDLVLPRSGGSLVVEPPKGWRPDDPEGRTIAVYANGAREDLEILVGNWALPQSGFAPPTLEHLALPQMEPAEYTVCVERPYAAGKPECRSGTLNSGGELTLAF